MCQCMQDSLFFLNLLGLCVMLVARFMRHWELTAKLIQRAEDMADEFGISKPSAKLIQLSL